LTQWAEARAPLLCHDTRDKPAGRRVARRLVREGLRPWFDEWHAPPAELLIDIALIPSKSKKRTHDSTNCGWSSRSR